MGQKYNTPTGNGGEKAEEISNEVLISLLQEIPQQVNNILKFFRIGGLHIFINKDTETLHIKDKNGKEIGIIGPGSFFVGEDKKHLMIEINEDSRGLGLGKKIFQLYDSLFGTHEFEYAKTFSFITFYQSLGYEIESWLDKNGEEIEEPSIFQELMENKEEHIEKDTDIQYVCVLKRKKY